MTTWKLSLHWPLFVACSATTGAPQRVHLKFVVLGGLGQSSAFGFKLGSRSMYMLNASQLIARSHKAAHSRVSKLVRVWRPMYLEALSDPSLFEKAREKPSGVGAFVAKDWKYVSPIHPWVQHNFSYLKAAVG